MLACGGLIAAHAASGGCVAVIAVTDGEASHRGDKGWPPAKLALMRSAERMRGLARLGVRAASVERMGLVDGAVAGGRARLREALQRFLRAGDIVVTTWPLDGHPDHDATGVEAERACIERDCELLRAPVWMWHWSAPGDARVPWQQLRGFALTPDGLDRKTRALAEHATQLSPRFGEGPVLGASILERAARRTEFFFV
ncbi:MAG: PIG-L family deacetylase [Burkholderiaceae bacterium]